MSGISCKFIKAAIFASVFIILTGCNYSNQFSVQAVEKEPTKISAWLAYWDLDDGTRDLDIIGDRLDKLSFFGASFDKDDHVFIPPELSAKKA